MKTGRRSILFAVAVVVLISVLGVISCAQAAVNALTLRKLLYYTVLDVTYIDGTFQGADFGKTVKLANGMVFEFMTYSYTYAYRPDVVVFVRLTEKPYLYKLLIGDTLYDVIRVS